MDYKIAVITPINKRDYLVNTVLDGLLQLKKENNALQFYLSSECPCEVSVNDLVLPRENFIDFAFSADLIFFISSRGHTDFELAKKINLWEKMIFIDGSEVKKNKRFDFSIQKDILLNKYDGCGAIEDNMLSFCSLYFRREKPYIKGIIPFPFGIDSRFIKYYNNKTKKDIDFVCIFGQDEYPLMRRYSTELLEKYCKKNNFSYCTKKTKTPDEFYKLLSRAKVGVSVGGGGYDTVRFWEILGNNCLLLTEHIDIYHPDSKELDYRRIWQFNNLYDFQYQLDKVAQFLRNKYRQEDLEDEYQNILSKHLSINRILKILQEAKLKGLIY